MRYWPVFIDTRARAVLVAGAGETAVAKLRLLLKTEAQIHVYGSDCHSQVQEWAAAGRLTYRPRPVEAGDFAGMALAYAAPDDAHEASRVGGLARAAGVPVNVVDTPEDCDFITPALVDRAPVVVAIGSEGTAPVLVRLIKDAVEAMLPSSTGALARLARRLRPQAATVPAGAPRRALWARFFREDGPRAYASGGEAAAEAAFGQMLSEALQSPADHTAHVALVGAGPGDPELLTRKAHRLLGDADVVIHDRLVSGEVLELARREARLIPVGKVPFGPGWKQDDINALLIAEARRGGRIVRLKSGDPGVYGRLDEEVAALQTAGIAFEVVPGITAAVAGAAELGLSLTRRGRNTSFRLLTGHDIDGFAEHDWQALARPGSTAAVYMGVSAARFIQGRLLMHGAAPSMPVTVVENVSRADRRELVTTLAELAEAMGGASIAGPSILYLGLAAPVAHPVSIEGGLVHAKAG